MAKMERGTGVWLIAAIAVLFGLRGFGGTAAPDGKLQKPEAVAPQEAGDKPAEPANPLAAKCDARLAGLLDEFARLDGAKPRPLIALVPDPLDTGLAYYFDAVLEGIEAALGDGVGANAEHRGWVRDRFFLPWRELDGDKASDELAACRTTHPGLVLYREQSAPGRGRAVFLVGESQTWGVPRAAAARAIELSLGQSPKRFQLADARSFAELDFVGPTFSGTAPSLAAVLADATVARDPDPVNPAPTFRVRSGTASGSSVARTFERHASIKYASSATSDADLSDTLYCRLSETLRVQTDFAPGRRFLRGVALFSEGGTAYGAGFASAHGRGARCPGPEFTYIFPNLLDVRAAWGTTPEDKTLPSVRYTLGLGQARDPLARVHPVLSSFTPIARDVSLTSALNDLSAKSVRYVGIVATDVNDVVFLASRVRKQLPDVRLFAFGSDIVLEHPDQAATLSGMLLAHGVMPVSTTTARLDVNTREMVQGVFLATRSLLGEDSETEALVPQVSVVSRGKLWGVDPVHDRTVALVGTANPDLVPKTFRWFAVLFAAFALLNAITYLLQAYFPWARARWSPLPLRALRPCRTLSLQTSHEVRALRLLSAVAFPLLLVSRLLARAEANLKVPVEYYFVQAATLVAVAAAACALFRMTAAALRAGATPAARVNALFSFALSVFLGVGASYWAQAAPLARTVALGSGASPLLPVLLGTAIAYVISLAGLIRLRLLDGQSPPGGVAAARRLTIARVLGGAGGPGGLGGDLARVEQRVWQSLEHPASLAWLPLLGGAAALTFVLGATFTAKPLLTLERSAWDCLLVAVVSGCIFAQTSTYARLIAYFVELRMLLRRLAVHPIAAALRHLTPTLARTVETQLLTSRPEALDLAESVRLLGALSETLPRVAKLRDLAALPTSTELETWHREARGALATELEHVVERRVPGEAAFVLRENLALAAEKLATGLAPQWLLAVRLAGSEAANGGACIAPLGELDEDAAKAARRFCGCAEALVASLVALCLERYVRHFRYFTAALVATAVLFVPLTALYAFQPQHLLLSLGLVATTVIVGTVLGMYFALDRDPVLSSLASTTPGEVTVNGALVTRVLAWGVLPMASVVAAQYPEFTSWLLSALGPVTAAFK